MLVVTKLVVSGTQYKFCHSCFSNDDTRSDPSPSGGGTGGHVGHHRRRHIYTFRHRCFRNNVMETIEKDILAFVKSLNAVIRLFMNGSVDHPGPTVQHFNQFCTSTLSGTVPNPKLPYLSWMI